MMWESLSSALSGIVFEDVQHNMFIKIQMNT